MLRFLQYYGRFQGFRGNVSGLPGWAKFILLVAAVPGIVLMGLSILAFLVSLLALLVLTVPVYRVLTVLLGGGQVGCDRTQAEMADVPPSPGRRHIDVTIVE